MLSHLKQNFLRDHSSYFIGNGLARKETNKASSNTPVDLIVPNSSTKEEVHKDSLWAQFFERFNWEVEQ